MFDKLTNLVQHLNEGEDFYNELMQNVERNHDVRLSAHQAQAQADAEARRVRDEARQARAAADPGPAPARRRAARRAAEQPAPAGADGDNPYGVTVPPGGNKRVRSYAVYSQMQAYASRQQIINVMIELVPMTPGGAATYYNNARAQYAREHG